MNNKIIIVAGDPNSINSEIIYKAWKKIHYLIYPAAILSSVHFYMLVRADKTEPMIYMGIIVLLLLQRITKKLNLL